MFHVLARLCVGHERGQHEAHSEGHRQHCIPGLRVVTLEFEQRLFGSVWIFRDNDTTRECL